LAEFFAGQAYGAESVANGNARESTRPGGGSDAGAMHGRMDCKLRANCSFANSLGSGVTMTKQHCFFATFSYPAVHYPDTGQA